MEHYKRLLFITIKDEMKGIIKKFRYFNKENTEENIEELLYSLLDEFNNKKLEKYFKEDIYQ